MKAKHISFFAVALLIFCAVPEAKCAADANYIRKYDSDLSIRGYVAKKFTTLSYYTKDNNSRYAYQPNNPLNLGGGFSWKGITINASYGFSFLKNSEYGDTDSADTQMNYYKGRFAMGFTGQKYTGFYLKRSDEIVKRPDMEIINLGGYLSYMFNGDEFSYKAAFNQSEKQIRSAGSWQAGIEAYFSKIKAAGSLDPKAQGSEANEPQEIESYQIGPNAGYVYTWVFEKNFYATFGLALGINVDFTTLNDVKQPVTLRPSIFPRLALGYDTKDWSICLSHVQTFGFIASDDDENIALGIGTLKLTFTKRFNMRLRAENKRKALEERRANA